MSNPPPGNLDIFSKAGKMFIGLMEVNYAEAIEDRRQGLGIIRAISKELNETFPADHISNTDEITGYIHCSKCIDEIPDGVSPKEWQSIQAGWTPKGLQIWCKRHECNIVHIDFEGFQHPANITRREGG